MTSAAAGSGASLRRSRHKDGRDACHSVEHFGSAASRMSVCRSLASASGDGSRCKFRNGDISKLLHPKNLVGLRHWFWHRSCSSLQRNAFCCGSRCERIRKDPGVTSMRPEPIREIAPPAWPLPLISSLPRGPRAWLT